MVDERKERERQEREERERQEREERERAARQASGAGEDAEPPLGYRDEQQLWNRQRQLISEDRAASLHLEGFSEEQANEIVEVMGDDADEEAQGGSSSASDDYAAHGGFPERGPEEAGDDEAELELERQQERDREAARRGG